MLANGEGGPVDGKAAIALLRGDLAKRNGASRIALAELLLDNRFTGRMPREATQLYAGPSASMRGSDPRHSLPTMARSSNTRMR